MTTTPPDATDVGRCDSTTAAPLAAHDLHFAYEAGKPILRGLDVSLQAGQLLCILGPNGSGKTTLLRCLLGQLTPDRGAIDLDARPLHATSVRERARRIAYVPQTVDSAFAFSVRELVLVGRYAHGGLLGIPATRDLDIADEAMRQAGVDAFADRSLNELSGGEAQCVMIARALAQQPAIMLLDEPTSHLDLRNQVRVYRLLVDLARRRDLAVACVSHDINLAARFADRLLLMRDGGLIAEGPPRDVVTRELIEATYDTDVDLIPRSSDAPPIVAVR